MNTRCARAGAWLAAALVTVAFLPFQTRGDWVPDDGHKMHWPQLPDPNGWDVRVEGQTVADDWMCTQSGPVSGIHFWVSWHEDGGNPADILNVHLSIHSDIPDPDGSGPMYSMPGAPLWQQDFAPQQIQFTGPQIGVQGWYDPAGGFVMPNDHQNYWQINVANIPEPFFQLMGTVYWLDVQIATSSSQPIGWKTTTDVLRFNDDAVYWQATGGWGELRNPLEPTQSLDMAFVIVPEPSTGVLFFMAAAGLSGAVRTFRKKGL